MIENLPTVLVAEIGKEVPIAGDYFEIGAHPEVFEFKLRHYQGLKWFADEALDILMWIFLGLWILLAYAFDFGFLPEDIALVEAAAFLINFKLLAKPLGDIGKVYTKWREAYTNGPAAERVFLPW